MHGRRRRCAVGMLVSVALLIAACGSSSDDVSRDDTAESPSESEPLATASMLLENVEVTRAGDTIALSADEQQEVDAGDAVTTDTAGRAEIAYFDGSMTRLGNDANFTVIALSDDEGERQIAGSLDSGSSWHRVRELSGTEGTYSVQTPVATATAAGTAFAVVCVGETECTFTVIEGTVIVELPDGTTFTLEAGDELTVEADADPAELDALSSGVEALSTDPWIAENLSTDGEVAPGPDDEASTQELAPIRNAFGRGRVISASPLTADLRSGLVAPGVVVFTEEITELENADVTISAMIDCTDACVITDVLSFFFPGHYGEEVDRLSNNAQVGMGFGEDGEIQPDGHSNLRVAFDLPTPVTVGETTSSDLRGTLTCGPGSVGFTLSFEIDEQHEGEVDTRPFRGSLNFDSEVHRFGSVACWTPSMEFDSAASTPLRADS